MDTRTVPSGCRTATYNSSSPADALWRRDAPVPRSRAAITSGRVAWFSNRLRASGPNSESPTTTPPVSMSVMRSPSASPARCATASASASVCQSAATTRALRESSSVFSATRRSRRRPPAISTIAATSVRSTSIAPLSRRRASVMSHGGAASGYDTRSRAQSR